MRAIRCVVYGNNRWGYCYTPIRCKSISEAHKVAKQFFFARIVVEDGKTRTIHVRGSDD